MQAYPSGLEGSFWNSNISEINNNNNNNHNYNSNNNNNKNSNKNNSNNNNNNNYNNYNNVDRKFQKNLDLNYSNLSYRFPYLSYSANGKRCLDTSLTQWLLNIQILKPLTANNPFHKWCPLSDFNDKKLFPIDNEIKNCVFSHSSFKQYTTLLAWEGVIRDGTVLCDAADWLAQKFDRSTTSFSTHSTSNYYSPDVFVRSSSVLTNTTPRTFTQCVAKIEKCLCTLRGVHSMSTRYLSGGKTSVGEFIVRGCWDAVWGLLEDIRRYVRSTTQLANPDEQFFFFFYICFLLFCVYINFFV